MEAGNWQKSGTGVLAPLQVDQKRRATKEAKIDRDKYCIFSMKEENVNGETLW
jgi:hypothetical protein